MSTADQQGALLKTRRVWVSPFKVERIYDGFQRQHILRVWLRWPTYRQFVRIPDKPGSVCGGCGVGPGEIHYRDCINLQINMKASNA